MMRRRRSRKGTNSCTLQQNPHLGFCPFSADGGAAAKRVTFRRFNLRRVGP